MDESKSQPASDTSLSHVLRYTLWYYVWYRRGWIVLSILAITALAALSWGWLAAVGLTSVLLAFLPCAAMCAFGLCMHKMGGKARKGYSDTAKPNEGRLQADRTQTRSLKAQRERRQTSRGGDRDQPTNRASVALEPENTEHD